MPSQALVKASRHLEHARLAFVLCLLPCVLILPQIFRENLGMSDYGIMALTIVPYTVGFLLSAYLLCQAAGELTGKSQSQRVLRKGLYAVAMLQIALLMVPVIRNDFLRLTHVYIGMTLFAAEGILAIWMQARLLRGWTNGILVLMMAASGLTAYLSLGNILKIEALSQLVFQLAFMTLCIRGAKAA